MIIRNAEFKDCNDIIRLLKQVNLIHHNGRPDLFNRATKYTVEQLKDIIKDTTRPILVAEEDGLVTGYAFCVLQSNSGDNMLTDIKTLYVDDLCVDEKKRKKGIGAALYNAAVELAKKLGCHNVTLNVWALNEGALKFYEAMGMKPLKTYMEHVIK